MKAWRADSGLDSNFTPARFGANYFPWPGCSFTIGSIRLDSSYDSSWFRYSKDKLLLRKLSPVVVQSSKSPEALVLRLGYQSWPLIFYALCFRSGCLQAGKLDLLEMTGLFLHCLGYFTFSGPLWTSALHHFSFTMVPLQSGVRWWSGPLTDISPNSPDSPFTNFLHSSFIPASWPL